MTLQWVQRKPSRSHLVLLLSTLIILLGGGVTLLWQIHQGQSSRAEGGNIVGPPTLPAETVDKIFASVGSPMAGTGKVVEQAARRANVDDAFALAVWWVETNDGQAGVGLNNRNPGAVQGTNGYILYPSYADAVTDWFTVLRSRYINRGLTSVYTICYPYVGTSSSLQWANKVVTYMLRYQGEAPPTPTPTLDHAPINLQTLSSNEPAVDQSGQVGGGRHPIETADAQPATGTLTTMSMHSTQNSLPLVISGLLAALALALVGLRVRRRSTMILTVETVTESLEPALALPPLYVNEYSPIAEPISAPWWEQSQQAQGVQAVAGPISTADGQFLPLIAEPISVVNGVPQLSFDEPVIMQPPVQPHWAGGAPGKLRARRLVQVSTDFAASPALNQEQSNARSTEELAGSYPTTEMLPPLYRPGFSLPGAVPQQERMPELASAGTRSARTGGGLLRRYGMEQASEQQGNVEREIF